MIKTHPYPDLDLSVSDSGRCVDISYSCPGRCKFALYENMPPEDDDICCFSDCGNCRQIDAKAAALKAAQRQISKAVKDIEAEE